MAGTRGVYLASTQARASHASPEGILAKSALQHSNSDRGGLGMMKQPIL